VLKELRELGRRYEKLVLLLDADVAGRQARNLLDRSLSGCWHAFISAEESTLLERKDYKDEGDVGVEHAGKNAILESLLKIRRSYPERKVFVREDLISYKLIAPLHERV
jgi:5S rRNA maturation endonuclease (ribonuclease M5)